jgi:hypothetical protein
MSDASASIAHFDSIVRILKDLASHKIALYEHHYHPQAFGSFVLVLGHAHERARFSWDGRECILSISFDAVPSKNASASWTHGRDVSLPNGQGLYEEIASNAAQMLAI